MLNLAMQFNPNVLAQMPDSHRAIAESRPTWVTILFALSVVNGDLWTIDSGSLFPRVCQYGEEKSQDKLILS